MLQTSMDMFDTLPGYRRDAQKRRKAVNAMMPSLAHLLPVDGTVLNMTNAPKMLLERIDGSEVRILACSYASGQR